MRLDRSIIGYTKWIIYMVFIAIPERFGVLVGDLPVHDFHHLAPYIGYNPKNWQKYFIAREEAIRDGDVCDFRNREVWGLFAALDKVFEGLAKSEYNWSISYDRK